MLYYLYEPKSAPRIAESISAKDCKKVLRPLDETSEQEIIAILEHLNYSNLLRDQAVDLFEKNQTAIEAIIKGAKKKAIIENALEVEREINGVVESNCQQESFITRLIEYHESTAVSIISRHLFVLGYLPVYKEYPKDTVLVGAVKVVKTEGEE